MYTITVHSVIHSKQLQVTKLKMLLCLVYSHTNYHYMFSLLVKLMVLINTLTGIDKLVVTLNLKSADNLALILLVTLLNILQLVLINHAE
mgnify:CR=1 FL=1